MSGGSSTSFFGWVKRAYEKYGGEAREVNALRVSHVGELEYGLFESYVAYCLVRELKPSVVWDLGSSCGGSVYPLALAVKRNGCGKVFSFELDPERVEKAKQNMRRCGLYEHVVFVQGDVLQTCYEFLDEEIDVLHIDCDHREHMAEWYVKTIWPKVRGVIHVHDFYYFHPDSGETKVVKDFLRRNPSWEWIAVRDLRNIYGGPPEGGIGSANSGIWIKVSREEK